MDHKENDDVQMLVWINAAVAQNVPFRKRMCALGTHSLSLYKDVERQQLKGTFKLSSVINVIYNSVHAITVVLPNGVTWVLSAVEEQEEEFTDLAHRLTQVVVKTMGLLLEKGAGDKQQGTLEFILNLAYSEPNRDSILLAGVLPVLLKLLVGDQKRIAAQILALIARESEERKMAIQYQGALPILVNMLGGDGRTEAAVALTALIHNNEIRKQSVFESKDAINHLATMIHEGTEAERDAAIWLIAAVTNGSAERTLAIRSKRVLPVLVNLVERGGTDTTKEGVCCALANILCYSADIAPQLFADISKTRCIEKLVILLRAPNLHLLRAAVSVISNMTALSDDFRKDIFETGAVSPLLELLERDHQIATLAASSLWNLCLCKPLQTVLATQGVLNALKQSNADMSNPYATGAMLAMGHFDMDLPVSISEGPAEGAAVCILCHPQQHVFTQSFIIPAAPSDTVCRNQVCESKTAKQMLNTATAVVQSDPIIAIASPDFCSSIECYTLLMYASRIGKIIIICNIAQNYAIPEWLDTIPDAVVCDVSSGKFELFTQTVKATLASKNAIASSNISFS